MLAARHGKRRRVTRVYYKEEEDDDGLEYKMGTGDDGALLVFTLNPSIFCELTRASPPK
jgi:hypothetical protein